MDGEDDRLPQIPRVADEAREQHLEAHLSAADAVATLGPEVGLMFRLWAMQHMGEGLAGLTGSQGGGEGPSTFPAPRAFYDERQRNRLEGVRLALDHVDVRLRLYAEGHDRLVLHETPYVLHALVEGRVTGDDETNPGVIRTSVAGWLAAVSPYVHPEGAHARRLVAGLVERAAAEDAPDIVVGAWVAFCWMSIHPWVDGNGRTARLLLLLLSAPSLPLNLDLGVTEQFTYHRLLYLSALQAGQHTTPTWNADMLDATRFAERTVEWSTAGARLTERRCRAVEEASGRVHAARPDLTPEQVSVVVWVGLRRLTRGNDVAALTAGMSRLAPDEALAELAGLGVLERTPLPPSRRRHPSVAEAGWRVEPALAAVAGLPTPLG